MLQRLLGLDLCAATAVGQLGLKAGQPHLAAAAVGAAGQLEQPDLPAAIAGAAGLGLKAAGQPDLLAATVVGQLLALKAVQPHLLAATVVGAAGQLEQPDLPAATVVGAAGQLRQPHLPAATAVAAAAQLGMKAGLAKVAGPPALAAGALNQLVQPG